MGLIGYSLWERPIERIILALSAWKKNFWLIQLLAVFVFFHSLPDSATQNPNCCWQNRGCCWGSEPCTKPCLFSFLTLKGGINRAWLFWYSFWPNKVSVVNLLKNPLGEYPLHLLWDHWAHSQSCWQGEAQQDHRILPVLKYIVMLKLSSHSTIYNLLIRLN